MPLKVTSPPISFDNIELIFEHPDFVIVNKPNDISFHTEKVWPGFFEIVKASLKMPLWPVHRLDKLTSGIIIFAKNQRAAEQFRQKFENKKIEKTYIALSDKKPKKKQGKIIGDMKKSRNGSWIITKENTNPAITQFKCFSVIPNLRLFVIKPFTGKTHQIRVALKSLGSPIIGDTRYGGNNSDRAYLHAFKISFIWKNELVNVQILPNQGKLFKLPESQSLLKTML